MNAQPSMFDLLTRQTVGAPFQSSSETSYIAAVMAGPRVGIQKRLILDWVTERRMGATEDEIEVHCHLLRSAVCARVNELVKEGFLRDSGLRRETRWHRPAVVWAATFPASGTGSVLALEPAGSEEVVPKE